MGGGVAGGSGYGSSKTHNFFQSENQILEMTGLISVLSEPGSRREGGRGRLVSYYLSGQIRNNQGRVKGKVIVIKQRGPASGRPRCGRAYKRTGSQQFHSGSSLRQVSRATKETMGSEPLLANMLQVALLARLAL